MSKVEMKGKISQIERRMAEKVFLKFLFLRIRQLLDNIIARISRRFISMKTKIEDNKIIFMHYANKYQCNPSYICDELIKQGLNYDIVFVADKKTINSPYFPEEIRLVKRNSLEHFYEMATAKIWIDNAVCFPWEYVPKKKKQIYIDTWHGSMGLKRIDNNKIVSKKWKRAAKIAGRKVDYMISNSSFETDVYRSTYWSNNRVKILEYGHPRNDILFCDDSVNKEIKRKVLDFFGIEEDCNLVLYAPTFRNNGVTACFDLDYDLLLDALTKRFGGNWKIVNRYHFKVAAKRSHRSDIKNNSNILDGNKYYDIQELMCACDIGITDYSSWICDFVLTGKPGFIYASDLEEYDIERGFYYPLDSTPFPIATDNQQMEQCILDFDLDLYNKKKEKFLKDRGSCEDGHASERVVELIKQLM